MAPIRRKKHAMIRFLKKDVADLLANGLDTHAFGRVRSSRLSLAQHCVSVALAPQMIFVLGANANWGGSYHRVESMKAALCPFLFDWKSCSFLCKDFTGRWSNCG
jgi:hypothetical protein